MPERCGKEHFSGERGQTGEIDVRTRPFESVLLALGHGEEFYSASPMFEVIVGFNNR